MIAIDSAADVVDALELTTLEAIDSAGLRKAALVITPWSGDYWSFQSGCFGRRYADPHFPKSEDWKKMHDYVMARPASQIVTAGDPHEIDHLSPAEKYDLLTGDAGGALTAAMWEKGEGYYRADGKVEKWMGICEGWAQASFMVPRPRRRILVKAASGRAFHLYPEDIKALASLLWAGAGPEIRMVGRRSNEKDPAKDEGGHITSPAAFDPNPATWHLAVVNQIGRARRSLIMDTTYDYEVWNQPITGYDYSYFNPKTMKDEPELEDARVPRAELTGDPFARHRSAEAAAIVGVKMRVTYVKELEPEQRPTDGPRRDLHLTVDYSYDIELAEDGRIVGGEWHQTLHPDFLWTPPAGAEALTSAEDLAKGAWHRLDSLPRSWREAAWTAARGGLPLAKIVRRLVALAGGA